MVDLNATAAAVRAGYSPRTTGLYTTLMGLPHVRAAVDAALAEKRLRSAITGDQILLELARLGFSNMMDYLEPGDDGGLAVDMAKVSRDAGAAIQRVSVEYFRDPEGAPTGQVRRVQLTLADKGAALREIAKHLGLYRERLEIAVAPREPEMLTVVTGVPRADDPSGVVQMKISTPHDRRQRNGGRGHRPPLGQEDWSFRA